MKGGIRSVTSRPMPSTVQAQECRRGPVFLNEDGAIVKPDALYTYLSRFRKKLEREEAKQAEEDRFPRVIPPLHPRNLRKTFVTRGVEMGQAKAVQAAVGHSSIRTTLDIYAKARTNPQRKLIEDLSGGISRNIFPERKKD